MEVVTWSPLQVAVLYNNADALTEMLRHTPYVELDLDRYTLLELTLLNLRGFVSVRIVEILLQAGARTIYVKDSNGTRTPLHRPPPPLDDAPEEQFEKTEMLLRTFGLNAEGYPQYGKQINVQDLYTGWRLLSLAVEGSRYAQLLIKYGAVVHWEPPPPAPGDC